MTEFYKALFREAGYEMRVAADTTAAVLLFREFLPQLVVLDSDIPAGGGERGFEIIREISRAGVPVIFVTGLPERVRPLLVRNGRVRVFRKPLASGELLSCISEMLSYSGMNCHFFSWSGSRQK